MNIFIKIEASLWRTSPNHGNAAISQGGRKLLKKYLLAIMIIISMVHTAYAKTDVKEQIKYYNSRNAITIHKPVSEQITKDVFQILKNPDSYLTWENIKLQDESIIKIPINPTYHLKTGPFKGEVSKLFIFLSPKYKPMALILDSQNRPIQIHADSEVANLLKDLQINSKN